MFGVEGPLLGSVPECWNEVRFEREFKQIRNLHRDRKHDSQAEGCWFDLRGHMCNRSKRTPFINILEANNFPEIALEPLDQVNVACKIQEAISTPLVSTSTTQAHPNQNGYTTHNPSEQENPPSRDVELPDGYPLTIGDLTLSRTDSLPFSQKSRSSTTTSLTTITDTSPLHEQPCYKNSHSSSSLGIPAEQSKPQTVGNIVNLDSITLDLRFEYYENPKKFLKQYRNDKAMLEALASDLKYTARKDKKASEDWVCDEQNEQDGGTLEECTDEESEYCELLRTSKALIYRTGETVETERQSEDVSKVIFTSSSLFDAHKYSIPQLPNALHKLGNNFVGFDRYRMSAALTHAERFEKLLSDLGETLELSAHFFIHKLKEPDANVPGHPDVTFAELLTEKRRRLKSSRNRPALILTDDHGRSVHVGFPTPAQIGFPGYSSQRNGDYMDMQAEYIPAKQNVSQFGLGVFRIDNPTEASPCASSLCPAKSKSAETRFLEESTFAVFGKEKAVPREMPGLIGDESNRFWPSQRAFSAIPVGHFLVPDRANAYRGLRLERDPRHPRWRRRSAPDTSARYASGPVVAVRRHSDLGVPTRRARGMYKHSWMDKSASDQQTKERDKGISKEPAALDRSMYEQGKEQGVASRNYPPASIVEFPALEPVLEETLVEESKLKELHVISSRKETKAEKKDSSGQVQTRQARHMRRVRFQL